MDYRRAITDEYITKELAGMYQYALGVTPVSEEAKGLVVTLISYFTAHPKERHHTGKLLRGLSGAALDELYISYGDLERHAYYFASGMRSEGWQPEQVNEAITRNMNSAVEQSATRDFRDF
jgi:hypothetical protein